GDRQALVLAQPRGQRAQRAQHTVLVDNLDLFVHGLSSCSNRSRDSAGRRAAEKGDIQHYEPNEKGRTKKGTSNITAGSPENGRKTGHRELRLARHVPGEDKGYTPPLLVAVL